MLASDYLAFLRERGPYVHPPTTIARRDRRPQRRSERDPRRGPGRQAGLPEGLAEPRTTHAARPALRGHTEVGEPSARRGRRTWFIASWEHAEHGRPNPTEPVAGHPHRRRGSPNHPRTPGATLDSSVGSPRESRRCRGTGPPGEHPARADEPRPSIERTLSSDVARTGPGDGLVARPVLRSVAGWRDREGRSA